jgi:hypothetical protein
MLEISKYMTILYYRIAVTKTTWECTKPDIETNGINRKY